MGILTKVKELFEKTEKKPIETLRQLEEELAKILIKNKFEMIALIGTGGRLKGLPLVYAADDEGSLKILSARLSELLKTIQNLSEEDILRDIIINYNDSVLFFKPIMTNISFFAIVRENNDILILKQFIYKNEDILKELFHDKI
jgi:hypothetical protein